MPPLPPPPPEIFNDVPWGNYGYFLVPHNDCDTVMLPIKNRTVIPSFIVPFNNMQNRSAILITPTVAFFAAINHNLIIWTLAISGPWKPETYKMDQNPPITAKNMTF